MRSQSEGRITRSARRRLGTGVLSCVVPDERQPVLCMRDQATEDPILPRLSEKSFLKHLKDTSNKSPLSLHVRAPNTLSTRIHETRDKRIYCSHVRLVVARMLRCLWVLANRSSRTLL
jgi:hypothetical protein